MSFAEEIGSVVYPRAWQSLRTHLPTPEESSSPGHESQKTGLDVDPRSCKTLSYKQSIALTAIERNHGCFLWDVSPVKPVIIKLVLCRGFCRAWSRTDLRAAGWYEQQKHQTASPSVWSE